MVFLGSFGGWVGGSIRDSINGFINSIGGFDG